MNLPAFDPAVLTVDGDITLGLAQRTGHGLRGHRVAISTDVGDDLRAICRATLNALGDRNAVPYSDDLAFDTSAEYMVVQRASLVAHTVAPRRGRPRRDEPGERPQVEMDAATLQVLDAASSLPQLNSRELNRQSFAFYAAVVGDNAAARVAFVRAWNPYKVAFAGRLLTMFGDRLHRIEDPLLAFDRSFDIVVTAEAVAIMSADPFEKLFRDVDTMRDRIPVWSEAVVTALPLDPASADRLEDLCARNSRAARLARNLYERGVLSTSFAIGPLEDEMRRQGFEADRLVKDGKLFLEHDPDVISLLKLVDERLYTGWSSNTPWDVGSRSKRST